MKKIYLMSILSLCAILAGCGKCDVYTPNNPIKVVKADYDFTPAGGDGTIELEPTGSKFKAFCDVDWLTPVVKGNKIVFSVPVYTGITERNAIIKITSTDITTSTERITTCTVIQQGALLYVDKNDVNFSKDGGKESIKLVASLPYNVTKSDSWFNYTITGNNIEITAEASTLKLTRSGKLTISANREGSSEPEIIVINVNQEGSGLVFADLLGTWDIKFTQSGTTSVTSTIDITEETAGTTYSGDSPKIMGNLLIKFKNGVLSISAGTYYGQSGSYHVFLTVGSTSGSLTWNENVSLSAEATQLQDGKISYAFKNDGSWPDEIGNSILFTAFTANPPTVASYVGNYVKYADITISKAF